MIGVTRRRFIGCVAMALAALHHVRAAAAAVARLDKPRDEWKRLLKPEQYRVLFESATERPFTSPLEREKSAGTYICAACYLPLFSSAAKFESGTGWPSFFEPIAADRPALV